MLKNLGIIIACERPLIWDCAGSGALSRSKYILIKLDISIGCYFTVCRAKFSAEIGPVLPENEGTRCGLHRTATPFFVLPFHHTYNPTTMVREKTISDDLRKVILNMARHFDVAAIHHYTGCSAQSIRQFLGLAIVCKLGWKNNYQGIKRVSHRKREN
jgi:hypothetical protein